LENYITAEVKIILLAMWARVFCEVHRYMKRFDLECWYCKENVINGGTCNPFIKERE
jgi:hypothetical protein